jgi:hypothetical protein
MVNRVRVMGTAVAMAAAPVLVMIGTGLDKTGADDTAVYLREVAAARGQYLLAGLFLAVGMAAFLPAAAGLLRIADRADDGVLRIGAFLLGFGALVSGNAITSGFAPSYVATGPGIDPVQVKYLEGLNSSPWAILGFVGAALGLGLGFILIGIGLWRTRAVPRWAAVMVVLTPIAFAVPSAQTFDWIVWLLAVVPFGLAARGLLKTPATAQVVVDSA